MRNAINALVLGLVLTLSTAALAQPLMTPIQDPEEPARRAQLIEQDQASESVATATAVGTTLAGLGLTAAAIRYGSSGAGLAGIGGLIIGPSAGHLYAGEWVHAFGMSAVRTAGAFVFLVGFISSTSTEQSSNGGGSSSHSNGTSMMLVGATAYLASTVYDIYDASRAARRSNLERGLVVVPTVGQNASSLGLAVAGRF